MKKSVPNSAGADHDYLNKLYIYLWINN